MKRIVLLLLFVMLLAACAPKYQYVSPEMPAQSIERIYVVLDYVEFVDDVGQLFDYDLPLNQQRLDDLQQVVLRVLNQKGYEDVYFVSRSSGVTLNPSLEFELYHNKKFQEKMVSPPFMIAAQHITIPEQDALLSVFKQFQTQSMVEVKEPNMNYLNRLKMPVVTFSDAFLETGQQAGIVFVQVVKPRVSFAKGFGMALASTAISVGASGGSFYATVVPHGVSYSNAFLFDMQSGDLLWKNFQQSSVESMQPQSLNNYFKHFPVAGH